MISEEIIWLPFQVILVHVYHHAKGQNKLLYSFLKFYMFLIRLWYDDNSTETDIIVNKCNNCDKTTAHMLNNEELNEIVTNFVRNVVLYFVVLS